MPDENIVDGALALTLSIPKRRKPYQENTTVEILN